LIVLSKTLELLNKCYTSANQFCMQCPSIQQLVVDSHATYMPPGVLDVPCLNVLQ